MYSQVGINKYKPGNISNLFFADQFVHIANYSIIISHLFEHDTSIKEKNNDWHILVGSNCAMM